MLKKNYEFKRVLSKGKYYPGEVIDAVILKNNNKNNFLGIAINTKVGKAVTRNRLKRLIRESYKNIETELIDGKSIVFLWKKNKNAYQAKYQEIFNDMRLILEKAEMLKEVDKI